VPQQQQVSMKPTGGETSGFFFGDEGVDTAASFIDAAVFSNTSQQATYAAQALVSTVTCQKIRPRSDFSLKPNFLSVYSS
jgi:hypothetical protein